MIMCSSVNSSPIISDKTIRRVMMMRGHMVHGLLIQSVRSFLFDFEETVNCRHEISVFFFLRNALFDVIGGVSRAQVMC